MSQNGDISNTRQDKEQASKELNPWLLKHLADRALPFTAQPLSHLGGSSSRLAKWVVNRAGLASGISRAIHLPLLSRAFDSIWRKPTFIPPVWQRMLDLPWSRQSRKQGHSFTQTTSATADGKLTNTVGLRNEHYPNTLVQTFRDAEEERLVDKTDEIYSLFPNDLFSLPITGRKPLTISNNFPHGAPTRILPVQTKEIANTHYSHELNQGLRVSREEQPARTAGEAYPLVIKNLFSSPAARERLSDITSGLPHHARATPIPLMTKQKIVGIETQDADNFMSSYVGQGRIQIPGIYKSKENQKPAYRHIKGTQEKLARVSWQPRYIYPGHSLPRVLTPITQRASLQRMPVEAHPHIADEDVHEGHASLIRHFYHPKGIVGEGESNSVMTKQSTLPSPVSIPRDSSKRPSQPALPGTANKPDEMVSDSLAPQKVTPDEGSRVFPNRVAPQRIPEVSQTRAGEPIISRQIKHVRQEADITHIPEAVANFSLNPDMPNLVTPKPSSIDRGFTKGYDEKPLLYRQPLPISGSATEPPPLIESIPHTITLPSQQLFRSAAYVPLSDKSENYSSLQNRENLPSSPSYKDANQATLELPVASSAQPKAEFSVARSEELVRQTSDTVSRLTYARNNGTNNGMPELVLAPIARAAETSEPPQTTTPEPLVEESGNQEPELDITALAREIYPLIKRMVMVERERRPT